MTVFQAVADVVAERSVVMEVRVPYGPDDAAKVVSLQPYTQVRNDLLDEAMPVLNDTAFKVAIYIARQTSGFHRDTVVLTLDTLMQATGHSRQGILNALAELRRARILESNVSGHGRGAQTTYHLLPRSEWQLPAPGNGLLSRPFNRSTEKSLLSRPKVVGNGLLSRPKVVGNGLLSRPFEDGSGQKSSGATARLKKDLFKEKREKESILVRADAADETLDGSSAKKAVAYAPDSEPFTLAAYLRDAILAHKPDARLPRDDAKLQGWARVCDLMVRIDKRDPATICRVIDWATHDTFWQPNILSPGKLREKFDTLQLQMSRRPQGKPPARAAPQQQAPPVPIFDKAEDKDPWRD